MSVNVGLDSVRVVVLVCDNVLIYSIYTLDALLVIMYFGFNGGACAVCPGAGIIVNVGGISGCGRVENIFFGPAVCADALCLNSILNFFKFFIF